MIVLGRIVVHAQVVAAFAAAPFRLGHSALDFLFLLFLLSLTFLLLLRV